MPKRFWSVAIAVALACPLVQPTLGLSQDQPSRPEIRLDLEYLYLTGTASIRLSDSWLAGADAGFGLGHYLDNSDENFIKNTHVGLVLTRTFGPGFSVHLGGQVGLGEYRPPECTGLRGCWGDEPEVYKGAVAGFSASFGRVLVGTRFTYLNFEGESIAGWIPAFIGVRI